MILLDEDDVVFVSEKLPSAALQAKAKSLELPPAFYNYLEAPPCKGCIGCHDEDIDDFDELIWGPRRGSQRETETPSTTSSTSVFGEYVMIKEGFFCSGGGPNVRCGGYPWLDPQLIYYSLLILLILYLYRVTLQSVKSTITGALWAIDISKFYEI